MIKKSFKNVFVTVGTTQFDELVRAVISNDVLEELVNLGCETLTIQFGKGLEPDLRNANQRTTISVTGYSLKSNIADDISKADLVISHAGAGSCIEVLEAGKTLIVVVNETLMDNHQTELAERLNKEKCLFYCTPDTLQSTLVGSDFSQLQSLAPGALDSFVDHLDKFMGFK
ncbi:UDP-N-acetylglucosamine transferase subunit ALG13 homolog [Anopheles ziemanni]|uniref:UDP-N-acetylglucosamine transferase subunit ALG13 homolog n=1 Tax=Anopheles coustani TaxID=139045 RepID=UPI002659925F|nr:UDP-N-acetylglucosamine transferase subunit ALG13 homolog [Anopheles coustani]XP_058173128.1 UDP-N-acetylglucosamine transferase subunit ALG13 homolog [Anopheles ziemanni]